MKSLEGDPGVVPYPSTPSSEKEKQKIFSAIARNLRTEEQFRCLGLASSMLKEVSGLKSVC